MNPDPYQQYWNPYLAFGNRPHMTGDPTGGSTEGPDDWVLVNNRYVYNESVFDQASAVAAFGKGAEYAGAELIYNSFDGKDVQLYSDGSWAYAYESITSRSIGVSGGVLIFGGVEMGLLTTPDEVRPFFSGKLGAGVGIDASVGMTAFFGKDGTLITTKDISGNGGEVGFSFLSMGYSYGSDAPKFGDFANTNSSIYSSHSFGLGTGSPVSMFSVSTRTFLGPNIITPFDRPYQGP